MKETLDNLDQASLKLLQTAKTLGRIYIITNAAEGWVELSSTRFMPLVAKEIENDVTIISARTKYEKQFPHQYTEWKMRAFMETLSEMDSEAITNIIAIGDSNIELQAAYHLASQFSHAFIKTVKFRESPSTHELTKQIKLVTQQFE